MFSTPILLITFNRPDHVRRVLFEIRRQQPSELYIFQDGPRGGNEKDCSKIQEVREVIKELVDWPCELHTLYQNNNLGCGPGPMTALNWFFSENEIGIILEDDAVPHPDFFSYAEELLKRYKNDENVRAIGSMHLDDRIYGDGSYYFSMMNRTLCAWATWARAWKDFDLYHRNVTRKQFNQVLKDYRCGLRMREYWCERLEEVQKDALNGSSWDQQFWISIWLHHGKGIMPNVNLCTNIGFDETATHVNNPNSSGANKKAFPIMPLKHPNDIRIRSDADQRFMEIYFIPIEYGLHGLKRLPYRMNKRLKRLLGHQGSWISKNK